MSNVKSRDIPCIHQPYYSKYVLANNSVDGKVVEYEVSEIATDILTPDWSGDKLATYSFIEKTLKAMTGRVLTIIDASISDKQQNKAIKDLIRKEFVLEFEAIADLLLDKQRLERAQEGAVLMDISEVLA